MWLRSKFCCPGKITNLAQHIHCTHIIISSSFSWKVHVCIYPKWSRSVALYHPRAGCIFVVQSMWFHTQLDSALGTLDTLGEVWKHHRETGIIPLIKSELLLGFSFSALEHFQSWYRVHVCDRRQGTPVRLSSLFIFCVAVTWVRIDKSLEFWSVSTQRCEKHLAGFLMSHLELGASLLG